MIGVGKARGITSKLDGPYSNPSPTKGYQAAALIVASSCGSGILQATDSDSESAQAAAADSAKKT